MTRYTLTIGLFDKDTKRQKISTDIAIRIVSDLVVNVIGYGTIHTGNGIYTHNNRSIVVEPSLVYFVDGEKEEESKINTLAWSIKKALNQESIMLEKQEVNMCFIWYKGQEKPFFNAQLSPRKKGAFSYGSNYCNQCREIYLNACLFILMI